MRRFDPEYARLKALLDSRPARAHAGAAQHPPQQGRPGLVPLRDDRARQPRPRGRRRAVPLRRGDRRDHGALAGTPTGWPPRASSTRRCRSSGWPAARMVTNEVFVQCQVGYEVRCEAVAERGSARRGPDQHRDLQHRWPMSGDGHWGGQVPADFRVRFARAYDLEVQAWVDATRRGEVVGPTALGRLRRHRRLQAGMASLAAAVSRWRSTSSTEEALAVKTRPRPVHVPRGTPLLELPALVADLGYEWIELSPREDFTPVLQPPARGRRRGAGVQQGPARRRGRGLVGAAAVQVVGPGRGRPAGRGALLEAGHPDRRRPRRRHDELRVQRQPARGGGLRGAVLALDGGAAAGLREGGHPAGPRAAPRRLGGGRQAGASTSSGGSTRPTSPSSTARRTPSTRATTATASWTRPATC